MRRVFLADEGVALEVNFVQAFCLFVGSKRMEYLGLFFFVEVGCPEDQVHHQDLIGDY